MLEYFLFGGKRITNYNTTALVNNTAKTVLIAVPAGMRWYVIAGYCENADNVARGISISVVDASANNLLTLAYDSSIAAAGELTFPNSQATENNPRPLLPIIIEATDQIRLYWAAGGASAGGTAEYSAHVLEAIIA